jgi:hypothetical protein
MNRCLRSAFPVAAIAAMAMVLCAEQGLFAQARLASLKEMTESSNSIVTGKCVKKEIAWNAKRTKIFTQVTVRTADLIKGDPGAELVITVPGGRVGNTIYEVSDMPSFMEGEEMLVFVSKHPSGMNLVTGALQGKLSIVQERGTGRKVVQGASSLLEGLKSRGDQSLQKAAPQKAETNRVYFDDFKASIRTFVR